MTSELQTLRSENIKLKSEVEISAHKYSQSSFEGKKDKLKYYITLVYHHFNY